VEPHGFTTVAPTYILSDTSPPHVTFRQSTVRHPSCGPLRRHKLVVLRWRVWGKAASPGRRLAVQLIPFQISSERNLEQCSPSPSAEALGTDPLPRARLGEPPGETGPRVRSVPVRPISLHRILKLPWCLYIIGLTGPEEQCYGISLASGLAYGAIANPPCPSLPPEARLRSANLPAIKVNGTVGAPNKYLIQMDEPTTW